MTFPVRAKPLVTQMRRGRLPACSCRHARVDGLQRPSGRNAYPSGITRSNIMSPARSQPEPRTEVRLGARAHKTRTTNQAHAPPKPSSSTRQPRTLRLTRGPCTSKEQRASRRASRVGRCSNSSNSAASGRSSRRSDAAAFIEERQSRRALLVLVRLSVAANARSRSRARRPLRTGRTLIPVGSKRSKSRLPVGFHPRPCSTTSRGRPGSSASRRMSPAERLTAKPENAASSA